MWALDVFSLELRKKLSYRVDFWMEFLGPIVSQMMIAYFLWKGIFDARGGAPMGGYSFGGMMAYYLLGALVERIVSGPSWLVNIGVDIYEGALSRYLIYPVSFLGYKLTILLANAVFGALQLLLGILAYWLTFGFPPEMSLTVGGVAGGILFSLVSGVLFFMFVGTLNLFAFWAENVWSLEVLWRFVVSILGGGYLPLTLYPEWAQRLMQYLPFQAFVSTPIRILMGTADAAEISRVCLVTAVWACVASALYAFVWRRGLRGYSGVGM